MEIRLDSESLASVASAAIFDSLSEEARGNIIKEAVKFLLTPDTNRGYGVGKTPLQTAFEYAISAAAHQAISERVKNDPAVEAEIMRILGPLVDSAMTAEAENYNTTLADAIGNALGSWLGERARESSR